jgi:hypothetical protein
MSVINNNLLLTADAVGSQYQISRSCRFNTADTAFFSRTPTVAGNRKTWTWAGWHKRSDPADATADTFFSAGSFNNVTSLRFADSNKIIIEHLASGAVQSQVFTSQVFRDVSAWCHIVWACDTTQSTAANRWKLYINGTEITSFSSASYLSQNADTFVNSTNPHEIGSLTWSPRLQYLSGYLADVHFIDGQALTPSAFTETNATTGQLVPKAYTGTYGTNGFRLNFSNNSAATAATLGADSSGNGNNWTPNNLSVTAGAGNDSLTDTPTSYGTDSSGTGGVVRGNYCTLNPLDNNLQTLVNGNLQASGASDVGGITGTIGVSSGKWYWEIFVGSTQDDVGIWPISSQINGYPGSTSTSYGYYGFTGQKFNNTTGFVYGATFTSGDIIGVALNLDSGTLTFYKNGVSQGTAFSSLTGGFRPAVRAGAAVFPSSGTYLNFGQRPFAYAAPSGFQALCDTNLPTPTIAKGSSVFDTKLYTGNDGTQSITGFEFSPDLVWVKIRSAGYSHALHDTIRGTGTTKHLYSNSDAVEGSEPIYNNFVSFDANGFTLGPTSSINALNETGGTYVAWCWDAGSSTVTNTAGSITSQVRANVSAGFSVVTYTGTGANGTIGHGLGIAPEVVIIKRRDANGNWQVRHVSIAAASSIQLNLTNASASATTVWNSTAPSSSVFSVGTDATVNASAGTYVAYCFAPVTGYSSFSSYTGNGSADGAFAYLGFRPRFLLIKRTNSTSNWTIFDTKRLGYNVDNNPLYANAASTEATTDLLDITSNGFKLRSTDVSVNASGGTYIYAALAENSFPYARAR